MRVVGLVLAMVLLLSFTTQSAATVPFLTAPHQFPDVSVGPDASALGVTEYTDVCEEGGSTIVHFRHRDASRGGEMRIHNFGDSTRVLLELVRKGKTALSVDWDPGSMAISLQDASGREGHFMYGEVAQRWNPTTSNAQSLL